MIAPALNNVPVVYLKGNALLGDEHGSCLTFTSFASDLLRYTIATCLAGVGPSERNHLHKAAQLSGR